MAEQVPLGQRVSVSLGRKDILGSGTIVITDDDPTITLRVEDLSFVLTFEDGSGSPDVRVEPIDGRTARIVAVGFTNPLPVTWHTPNVGHLSGRSFGMAVSIQTVRDASTVRIVSYTFSAERA